ncbi:adenosylcobinamide-phosphate synthase CbiB [Halobacillus kuroshimensis]|uniref:adenosylcobinamide-phosphate synthase CbiB n=1 Tax=Halobacillus kuroshimensis TaxID=302481 RepID=UPI000413E8E1
MIPHLLALTLGCLLDYFFGDPTKMPHLVTGMGKLIAFLEKSWNKGRHQVWKGALLWIAVTGSAFLIAWGMTAAVALWSQPASVIVEGLLIWTTIAGKGLKEAALKVYLPLKDGDWKTARGELGWIVGRDTDHLEEDEIVRGTVETVAENVSDGVTAPLFYALIGGAPLAVLYRAVNTCDSMVGYKTDRYKAFGYVSAKMDDVFNYIPSRLTAWVTLIVSNGTFREKRWRFRHLPSQASHHPSPNSGWGEAAAALSLGVRLGGENTYFGEKSFRPYIGFPHHELADTHIKQVNVLLTRTVAAWIVLLWLGGIGFELAVSWGKSL